MAALTDGAWVRVLRASTVPARLRLVCLPHAGAGAAAYRPLARHLAEDVEVVAVQYPGREDRFSEPPLSRVQDLADGAADALRDLPSGPPAVLFGHSMGALVGWELAGRLADSGHPAHAVHLSSAGPAGGTPAPEVPDDDAELWRRVAGLGGVEPQVLAAPELLEVLAPALRADLRAVARYRSESVVRRPLPLVLHAGEEDVDARPADVQRWGEVTSAEHHLHRWPGGHFWFRTQLPLLGRLLVS